jgi:DNA-binding Lrp family transcriptional regulator
MMAYVLINTEMGSEIKVLATIKKIKKVIEAYVVYAVYAVYDLIIKIEAETMDKLKETMTLNIRRLNKVRSTLTMITIEQF